MLTTEPGSKPGTEGFLMDLDVARLESESINVNTEIDVPPLRRPGGGMTASTVTTHTTFGPNVMRGAPITGTAHFMAADILQAIYMGTSIQHEPKHDIESFIYVLAYSVARKAVIGPTNLDTDQKKQLQSHFHHNFGRMTLFDILASRKGYMPLSVRDYFPGIMSPPMVRLMAVLATFLLDSASTEIRQGKPLTHESVLSALDDAIQSFD
ncbi:hypothetical protein M413DRAFT_32910 [Hebeloma cylindrosporum]|uniref:Fungal-type protein kinase domain-containing protein n=1 Tax=Hebeloma cylindrosporum TaxID=76867 RepID=A0A0C2Y1F4_HEBCY|nr:hypothetical protein M413DRAFT_32910 [Hebeloma cylindrosporum h7]